MKKPLPIGVEFFEKAFGSYVLESITVEYYNEI